MQMCYIYAIDHYSAGKNNETMNSENKLIKLENITSSEATQAPGPKYHIFSPMWGFYLHFFSYEYIGVNSENRKPKGPIAGIRKEQHVLFLIGNLTS